MSETFLIKTTSFDIGGTIDERDANSFIIGPGELNGPGAPPERRNSDLKLYGFGALKWGEGVNQNVFRLLGNNSCPAKEIGDYNPATGNNDYDPGFDPLLPKDENDLGTGNGITIPIVGQNWFNTDDNATYVYLATGWISLLSGGGSLTLTGDLNMSTNNIHNVADPIDNTDAMSQGYADGRYLLLDGTWAMAGQLNMGTAYKITNLADPTNAQDAMTLSYANANYVPSGGGGNLDMNGFLINNLGDPIAATDAVNMQYANTNYVNKSGDTMTGLLTVNGGIVSNGSNISIKDSTTRTMDLGFNGTNFEINLSGTSSILSLTGTGTTTFVAGNIIANSNITVGASTILTGTDINTTQLTTSGNVRCNGDLYVNASTSPTIDSSILFWDSAAGTPTERSLFWQQSSSQFMVEDSSGISWPLLHTGNISTVVSSMTLINHINILNVSSGAGASYTLSYAPSGIPLAATWVLLDIYFSVRDDGSGSSLQAGGIVKINNIRVAAVGADTFPQSASPGGTLTQTWVLKTNTALTIAPIGDGGNFGIVISVAGWL